MSIEFRVGPETLVIPAAFTYERSVVEFIRGDVSLDGTLGIEDPLATLFHIFRGVDIVCPDAADYDDDGRVGTLDVILELRFLFLDGTAPAEPYPLPGGDPTQDALEECS